MIPLNTLLLAYLALYAVSSAIDLILEWMNIRNLRTYGERVPEGFQEYFDAEKLRNIHHYTSDKTRFGIVSTIAGNVVFLGIILSGILPWLAGILKGTHLIVGGLVFFAVPGLISTLAGLPFDYYRTFVIEEKYGFNRQTMKLWIADLFKGLVISVILGGILLSLLLLMVAYAGNTWWIWAWLIFLCFQLGMTVLYPTVIAPIFNTFTPIENTELAQKINALAGREDIKVKGIHQMDAGRRSRHTNAYFAGLGRTKRIVLYDTLLEAHEEDEILAILAHEIGHLKRHHIKKQLLLMGIASLVFLYIASLMIHWETLYAGFGFSVTPFYAGLFLVAVLWGPVGFFLSPLAMALSRRYEREADRYAAKATGGAYSLVRALKKMARDNLSNLYPHPWYVRFNLSHPPILERIDSLEKYQAIELPLTLHKKHDKSLIKQ